MIDNRAVITEYEGHIVLMHIVNNRAEHIFVYDSKDPVEIGTIINCRIDSGADNIGSCFAMYGPKKYAFVQKNIKNGTVLPLMYKKEAYGEKKAIFTDKLAIDGEYVAVSTDSSYVKASAKIPEDKKKEYIDALSDIADRYNVGVVIRTRTHTEDNGIKKAEEELVKICRLLDKISSSSEHLSQYSILYKPVPAIVKDVLWLCEKGIEEVLTDDATVMENLKSDHSFLSGSVNVADRVSLRFYEDKLINLCNLYSVNAKISEALSKKVYLKSGAFLTFDTTEAMTVIDVNTGKCEKGAGKEETFRAINLEAADEIARQLRIRNVSGMIVTDFINMEDDASYKELEDHLTNAFSEDRIRCRFIDFTKLKIAEIIRDRSGRSLYQALRS